MNNENLSNENKTEALNKHVVMQGLTTDQIEKVLDQLLIARGEHPTRVRNPLYGEERELAKALLNHFTIHSPTVGQQSVGTVTEAEEVCRCGNPSGMGNCHFEGDEELIYICADCGKRAEFPNEE